MLKIRKSEKEELRRLNEIYSAAFESNPCPPNLIEEDEDDNEPDMLPEIAMCDPTKNRFELFDDKGDLIGGAVLDASDSAINVLNRLFIAPEHQKKGYGYPLPRIGDVKRHLIRQRPHFIADFLIRSIIRTRLFNDYPSRLTITTAHTAEPAVKTHKTPPQNCSVAGFAYVLKQPKSLVSSGFRA